MKLFNKWLFVNSSLTKMTLCENVIQLRKYALIVLLKCLQNKRLVHVRFGASYCTNDSHILSHSYVKKAIQRNYSEQFVHPNSRLHPWGLQNFIAQ
jgi:hypothetical protein